MTVQIDRDEARRLAERELADPKYEDEPSLPERIVQWVLDRIADLLDGAAGASPGQWLAGLVAVALLVIIGLAVRRQIRLGNPRTTAGELFGERVVSAAEHLAAADAAAVRGDWRTAVVERFRGVVRGLEERNVIEARPGRTADEAALDAGAALPSSAPALRDGALVFDRVRYGDYEATDADDARLRALVDAAVSTQRHPASIGPTRGGVASKQEPPR